MYQKKKIHTSPCGRSKVNKNNVLHVYKLRFKPLIPHLFNLRVGFLANILLCQTKIKNTQEKVKMDDPQFNIDSTFYVEIQLGFHIKCYQCQIIKP